LKNLVNDLKFTQSLRYMKLRQSLNRLCSHSVVRAMRVIMAALRSSCGHYILQLCFYLFNSSCFFFFRRVISAVADWMSTIFPHMMLP